MEESIQNLDALIDQVYEDVSDLMEGYPVLKPIVDSTKFGEEAQDKIAVFDDNVIYLNGDLVVLKYRGRERECIALSMPFPSLKYQIEENTADKKGISNNPYVKGFIASFVLDILGCLEEKGYKFPGIEDKMMNYLCRADAGKVFRGREAYNIMKRSSEKKKWQGDWRKAILRYLCGKENGVAVFNEIIQKEAEDKLNDYLKTTGIAGLVGELIKIESSKESFTKISLYQTQTAQWHLVKTELERVTDNIDKASNEKLATTFKTITELFDGCLKFNKPFAVPEETEGETEIEKIKRKKLSELFGNLAEATVDFYKWAADYEKKEEVLCFGV